ncbi:hypothetical protein HUJ04_006074 [Dendroctonus ponderosae]|uniref:Ig-like domain-containing protein n=1 Tax=Dendroctonus ponderosae TaxID=77166 RepID=A0AAR5QKE5_DENPD|nr:hypothetical protein HUJ04_006074 [Dendroctonus ponderosae]
MSGINGETQVLYSFTFEFSLVCILCIMFAPIDVLGAALKQDANQTTSSPSSVFFADNSRRNIEAIEGQTVVIPCTVRNLDRGKVVSWIRTKDILILTSGPHTFASDFRFEVIHSEKNVEFWGLRIRGVKEDDAGQYECQVNSEPKMSLAYQLTVSALGEAEDSSKWLGFAKVQEPKEAYVQHASAFSISCEIFPMFTRNVNMDVWWLHDDTQILSDTKESRISIKTSFNKENNIIHSILSFDYVTWQDFGLYTCLQPSVRKDSLKLVIVEAESSEAMQRDFPSPSSSSPKFSGILPFNVVYLLLVNMYLRLAD